MRRLLSGPAVSRKRGKASSEKGSVNRTELQCMRKLQIYANAKQYTWITPHMGLKRGMISHDADFPVSGNVYR